MAEPELRRWLDGRTHVLETLRPGEGTADLRSWRASLADVRLLGIGEAVVGTRELAMLAHRLLEIAVVDAGVRVVALGAPEAAVGFVDEVVATGGDPEPAVESVGDWRWTTGDVRTAVAWLAEYNVGRSGADRVRVVGVDPVAPAPAVKAMGAYLRENDPDLLDEVAQHLNDLVVHRVDRPALPVAVRQDAERVRARLDRDGVPTQVRRHAVAVARAAELATTPAAEREAVRERLMVEAVTAVVDEVGDRAGEGPAVVWWGHARHVRMRIDDGVPSVGARLRDRYADAYYSLGLLVGQGEFRAQRRRRVLGVTRNPARHRLPPPPSDSMEATLGETGAHLVDLRADGVERPEWVTAATRMRVFADPTPARWKQTWEPARPGEFDGLAHVPRAHQAAVR